MKKRGKRAGLTSSCQEARTRTRMVAWWHSSTCIRFLLIFFLKRKRRELLFFFKCNSGPSQYHRPPHWHQVDFLRSRERKWKFIDFFLSMGTICLSTCPVFSFVSVCLSVSVLFIFRYPVAAAVLLISSLSLSVWLTDTLTNRCYS